MAWKNISEFASRNYVCGYCNRDISSNRGYLCDEGKGTIYLCHHCNRPTFFDLRGNQYPGVAYGGGVKNIEFQEVEGLYEEAKRCMSVNAYTASVLCSRKLLMNIAVSKGADEGKSFEYYVKYLGDKGYIPPDGEGWVDHIRKKGNEATHEIKIMPDSDAKELINFIEMLLKFIYEYPAKIRPKTE